MNSTSVHWAFTYEFDAIYTSPLHWIMRVHPRAGAVHDTTPVEAPTVHETAAWPDADAVPCVTKMMRFRTELLFCKYIRRLLLDARRGCAPVATNTMSTPGDAGVVLRSMASGDPLLVVTVRPSRDAGETTDQLAVWVGLAT